MATSHRTPRDQVARLEDITVKTLLTEDELQAGVARIAVEIAAAYGDRPLTIVGVLTGSIVLLADLIRQLDMTLRVGVLQASSYRRGTTRGSRIPFSTPF